ncbi:MAG: hypothetical protein ACD_64C00288G0001 [uncultured bacterium]|nr:MAG: hypothetical protein ACD_64C00288G0001 [uncultured bacterium]
MHSSCLSAAIIAPAAPFLTASTINAWPSLRSPFNATKIVFGVTDLESTLKSGSIGIDPKNDTLEIIWRINCSSKRIKTVPFRSKIRYEYRHYYLRYLQII